MSGRARRPTPPARQRPSRRRVLFYSHDFAGMGHISRTMAIAEELARRRPDAALVALTSALSVDAYRLPDNFDYVRLPTFARRHLYDGLTAAGSVPGMYSGIWAIREGLIQETVNAVEPHVLLSDDAPAGPNRELARALDCLRAADPPVQLVAGITDIADEPRKLRAIWRSQGVFDLLDHVYDRILIYGDPAVFDTAALYGFSAAALAKTTYCGYVVRDGAPGAARSALAALGMTDLPLVVVAAGGGTGGTQLLTTYMQAIAGPLRGVCASFVVGGPLLPEGDWMALQELAAGAERTTLVRSVPDLPAYFSAADVVVTMGGYNAVCEALSLGKRAVIVPLAGPFQEQRLRAERLVELGLARMLPQAELSADRLAGLVREALTAPPPSVALNFSGVAIVADLLDDALRAVAE